MPRKRLDRKYQLSSFVSENNVSEEVLDMLEHELEVKEVSKSALLREALEIYAKYKNNTLLFQLLKKHDLIKEDAEINNNNENNEQEEFVKIDSLEKLKKGKIG